jgi:hypothetical protein
MKPKKRQTFRPPDPSTADPRRTSDKRGAKQRPPENDCFIHLTQLPPGAKRAGAR